MHPLSMMKKQARPNRTGAVACARVIDVTRLTDLSLSVMPVLILAVLILAVLIIVVLLLTGGSGGG